jgi:hypothetical protein
LSTMDTPANRQAMPKADHAAPNGFAHSANL